MKKENWKVLVVFLAIVVVVFLTYLYFTFITSREDVPKTLATSENETVTTQSEWEQGALVSIDSTTTANSIKITSPTNGRYLIADDSEFADPTADNIADNSTFTSTDLGVANGHYLAINFLGPQSITSVKWYMSPGMGGDETGRVDYYNGSAWVPISNVTTWGAYQTENISITATRLRAVITGGSIKYAVCELQAFNGLTQLYTPSSATHTTGATQIDGGENFWEWENFTPTQDVPANTSVTYRYRSSANGTDWNAWKADIASVESRSGDTKYRYLQVEATLSNTDGVSTPTIDQYIIGYHTEIKPNKPIAQTAAAQ